MGPIIKGNQIQLVKSTAEEIDQIIDFEISNLSFVGQYSRKRHLVLLEDKDCLHVSIQALKNLEVIGHMILFGLMSEHKSLLLQRFTIAKKGKGYGREALQLIKKVCFEDLKFHRLWLDVYDYNSRAIGLYESEGFVKEGLLRDSIKTKTGFISQRIYSILDHEYLS